MRGSRWVLLTAVVLGVFTLEEADVFAGKRSRSWCCPVPQCYTASQCCPAPAPMAAAPCGACTPAPTCCQPRSACCVPCCAPAPTVDTAMCPLYCCFGWGGPYCTYYMIKCPSGNPAQWSGACGLAGTPCSSNPPMPPCVPLVAAVSMSASAARAGGPKLAARRKHDDPVPYQNADVLDFTRLDADRKGILGRFTATINGVANQTCYVQLRKYDVTPKAGEINAGRVLKVYTGQQIDDPTATERPIPLNRVTYDPSKTMLTIRHGGVDYEVVTFDEVEAP